MKTLARSLAFVAGALVPIAGHAAPPASPSCSATEKGNPVTVTWTLVPGATAYQISKGSGLQGYTVLGTVGGGVNSFQDPAAVPGTILYYCVVAINADGISAPGCAPGGYMQAATPSPCSVTASGLQNTITWTLTPDGQGYLVYRDGLAVGGMQSVGPNSYVDIAPAGHHTYCVQASNPVLRLSDPCCHDVTNSQTLATPACQATQNLRGEIDLHWSAVTGASGYHLTKDNLTSFTVTSNETTFVDNTVGTHLYTVVAFNDQGGSNACSATGISLGPYTWLSWATCEPQTLNQNFTGPGIYDLVVAARDLPPTTSGHDSQIQVLFNGDFTPALPDAWRFDNGGCQGPSRLQAEPVAVGGCPALLGANAVTHFSYTIAPNGPELDLTATYDDLASDPSARYVLWRIRFDHSNSIAGSDSNPTTCDGAETGLQFELRSQVFLGNGGQLDAPGGSALWQGGPPVRAQQTTWGHLKGLYR